mmetsp:Transcript_4980/g.8906  ORF Transcript_4980/g.8906 Transcript_4980/m.8906 type:complete len:82 (+) Transcript_4980:234-479(+)
MLCPLKDFLGPEQSPSSKPPLSVFVCAHDFPLNGAQKLPQGAVRQPSQGQAHAGCSLFAWLFAWNLCPGCSQLFCSVIAAF